MIVFVLGVSSALAAPLGQVTEFPLPTGSGPVGIAAGPDGNMWFTDGAGKIGRITPTGSITEFRLPTASEPFGIAAGPDGNMWFTDAAGKIGRITPTGSITEFRLPTTNGGPWGIAAGADGNMWFTEAGLIGQITRTGSITEFALPTTHDGSSGIAAGPDGNMWFTESGVPRIGRITPTGSITEFPVPNATAPQQIAAGPDGNMWFTDAVRKIGRITPTGSGTEFPLPSGHPEVEGIAAGPDGNMWFADSWLHTIGQITPRGAVTEYSPPIATMRKTSPWGIAAGPDGNMWFTQPDPAGFGGDAIGRIGTRSTVVILTRAARVDAYRKTRLVLACGRGFGNCAGTLALTARVRVAIRHSHRTRLVTRTLARTSFTVTPGGRAVFSLTLSRPGLRLLATAPHARLKVRARAQAAANIATAAIMLQVSRAPQHHKSK